MVKDERMEQAESISVRPTWRQRVRHGDLLFWLLTLAFAAVVIVLVVLLGIVTWAGSAEARATFGLGFLWQADWDPVNGQFGALPAIFGTLVSSAVALLIAGPLGVMIGVFLSELCPPALKQPLSFMVELLAAIPSVIYGMWGVLILAPFFRDYIAEPVAGSIGTLLPWLGGNVASGRGIMIAGVVLAIMILPTIAAISRDVVAVVPDHQREAMLSVGATRWEMITIAVLPYSSAGIIGAMMLGLGRALGETMAALMVIGSFKQAVPGSLFEPGISAAALVASELPNTNNSLHESTLILIALVLFGITLLLNTLARLLVWQVARGPQGARL
jgi:phosphate transport system permease protein